MERNSGATLEPAMVKSGANSVMQAMKMVRHPQVFAPVIGLVGTGFCMPMLGERTPGDVVQLEQAFACLRLLWAASSTASGYGITIGRHHTESVLPLVVPEMEETLRRWYELARRSASCSVTVTDVHGDATLENIMVYKGQAVWIDPSTRPMPLYAEFDCAKLLQTQFGYNGCAPEPLVVKFVQTHAPNVALTGYFLMTHLVRLYKVQPQARAWAVDVANTLEERLKEVYTCRS